MIEIAEQLAFTADWVTPHLRFWGALLQLLPARDKVLEIGAFEGRASCWFLEFLLQPEGELYCIDTWEGSPEFVRLTAESRENSKERFDHNIALVKGLRQRVVEMQMTSREALARLNANPRQLGTFDWIYVDAGHQATETLTNAVMAWPLLKTGGLMVFDDYIWNVDGPIHDRPKFSIDVFTTLWGSELKTIGCGTQYIVQKIN